MTEHYDYEGNLMDEETWEYLFGGSEGEDEE